MEDETTSNTDFPMVEMGDYRYSSKIITDQSQESRTYVKMYFRADSKSRYYKRWTDTLLEFIGDLGGLKEFILGIGFLLTYPFMKHKLFADLVNSVYQV